MRSPGPFVACALVGSLGCATVTPIHRPPTPAEIEEVNDVTGPMVVDLLPPAGPPVAIDHVISVDAGKILVARPDGRQEALRVDDVAAFSSHRTARGAAIGAGVGAGFAAFEILGILAFAAVLGGASSDPGAPKSSGCDASYAKFLIGFPLMSISVGALVGAVAGSPRLLPLNLREPSNP